MYDIERVSCIMLERVSCIMLERVSCIMYDIEHVSCSILYGSHPEYLSRIQHMTLRISRRCVSHPVSDPANNMCICNKWYPI